MAGKKMAEKRIVFPFKRLAELLVKEQGISDGYWGIYAKFGLTAANMFAASPENPSSHSLVPGVIVPMLEIGLQRFEELNDLSVDAAVVNPKRRTTKKAGGKKAGRKKQQR